MSKYLLKFDSQTAYDAMVKNGIDYPNVSLVKSPYNVYINTPFVDLNDALPGTIIAYSRDNGERFFVIPQAFDNVKTKYNLEAESVVIVPASHTLKNLVYGMSLSGTSCAWCTTQNYDEPGLPNATTLPAYGQVTSGETGQPAIINPESSLVTKDWVRYPCDWCNGTPALNSSKYKYYQSGASDLDRYGVKIYNDDWSRNEEFYNDKVGNTIQEFQKGESNTAYLVEQDAADNGRKYPAAMWCHEYNTPHVEAGKWFLPDPIQLIHAAVNKNAINVGIKAATGGQRLLGGEWLWTSSEYHSVHARGVNLSLGAISYYGKTGTGGVRAFAAFQD